MYEDNITKENILSLDKKDDLAGFRSRFYIPHRTIYMDGNSLGLLSKDSEKSLLRLLQEWKTLGIKGWMEGERPWFWFAEEMGALAATIVGARPEEVILSGTTTINIHALVSSFYNPHGKKVKILADELNFPSDIYALKGQLKLRGFDPGKHLVLAKADKNGLLNEQHIVDLMDDETALVFLPSVIYSTGQLLNMELLTAEAHKRNICIGFDCSHSVGAIDHSFNEWDVDFALWCSYKYLNGGPGSAAFYYVNKKHFNKQPLLAGWVGYQKEKQFDMLQEFIPSPNAGRWQISSPGILGSSAIEGSLKIIFEAGICNIRKKSLKLTSLLAELLQKKIISKYKDCKIVTPLAEEKRGGHIAIEHPEAIRINEALKQKGIIPDLRPPNIIRIAPVALYNTFEEVWEVVETLKEIIDKKEYELYDKQNKYVT